ncbi:transcription factor Opi1-domain-containing protein [Collybia nuda]|uniref:Transcription factor Opi1-domain-containing protein n=1 Tax=Collybia nuda TaxID=64659 RepID=A0A9P5Y911_9AGAR|nr:transcription factor Opi1-domain-containing protein [Collybia nuda]
MDDKAKFDDHHDESVRIAARALDDMRNSAQQPRVDSTSSTASASDCNSPFVSRMSHLPLVNSALRVYEQGKASSRVVKYSAEMMESSVKTISRPVIDRLPVNVNQLDEFACRQLDRFDRYRRSSSGENATPTSPRAPESTTSSTRMPTSTSDPSIPTPIPEIPDLDRPRVKLKTKTLDGSAVEGSWDKQDRDQEQGKNALGLGKGWRDTGKGGVPSWLEANSPFVGPPPPPPDSRSSTPTREQPSEQPRNSSADVGNERQVAQRSRWQAVLLEAGGLSAALSEESMRRLKYCLQWLQYATAHIDAQILILRDFTASLQPLPPHSQTRGQPHPISQAHLRTLTAVRRDIVQTIRQVVDVVSRYAGGALPEPARGRVRGFILELPQRWARKAGPALGAEDVERDHERERDRERERESVAAASGSAVRRGNRRAAGRERGAGAGSSATSSRAASPITRHPRHQEDNGEQPVSAGTAILAAQRILTLATESLDMMRGVTGVMKDSLDRAEAWVSRLRTVGIQRGGGQEAEDLPLPPPGRHSRGNSDGDLEFGNALRHRRGASSSSQFDDNDGMPSPYSGASSYSSYTGGSSIPSTPGAGSYTPGYSYTHGGYGGAPSPGASLSALGSMSLNGSRYSTPRSVTTTLPDEDDDRAYIGPGKRDDGGNEGVRIAGMDIEVQDDPKHKEDAELGVGVGKMEVDDV